MVQITRTNCTCSKIRKMILRSIPNVDMGLRIRNEITRFRTPVVIRNRDTLHLGLIQAVHAYPPLPLRNNIQRKRIVCSAWITP